MVMISVRSVVCALGLFLLLGCSDKAHELFETAAFEENQGNIAHAKELYEEIVRSYPSSKEAELARAHLADLK